MFYKFVYVIHLRFVIWSLLIFYLLASRVANIMEKQVSKFIDFYYLFYLDLRIRAHNCIRGCPRIQRAAATGHDVNLALEDPRGGSNAFRFCVSSATRESSQGQVVPRFRASLWHSGRALKIDSNQFYT